MQGNRPRRTAKICYCLLLQAIRWLGCDGLIDQAFGTTKANKLGSREPKGKYVEGATIRGWTGFLIKKPIDAIHSAGVQSTRRQRRRVGTSGWSQGQPHFPE